MIFGHFIILYHNSLSVATKIRKKFDLFLLFFKKSVYTKHFLVKNHYATKKFRKARLNYVT